MKDNFLKFCSNIPWFFKETDDITIYDIELTFSNDFMNLFPNLFKLLIMNQLYQTTKVDIHKK